MRASTLSLVLVASLVAATLSVSAGCRNGDEDERARPGASATGPTGGPQVVKSVDGPAVDSETRLAVGQVVPDFDVVAIDGRRLSAEKLRGSNVLLLFFSTTCRSCRAELVDLRGRLEDRRSKGLVVIAVGREDTAESLAAFQRGHKLPFPVVADPDRSLYDRFAIARVPRTYLIDGRGVLVHQTRDYTPEQDDELLRQVDALQRTPRRSTDDAEAGAAESGLTNDASINKIRLRH